MGTNLEAVSQAILTTLAGSPPTAASPARAWVEAHKDELGAALARGWTAAAIAREVEAKTGKGIKASSIRPLIAALAKKRKAKPAAPAAAKPAAVAAPAAKPASPAMPGTPAATAAPAAASAAPKPPAPAPAAEPPRAGMFGLGQRK